MLGDWGAPHERLVPGFVVETELDGKRSLEGIAPKLHKEFDLNRSLWEG